MKIQLLHPPAQSRLFAAAKVPAKEQVAGQKPVSLREVVAELGLQPSQVKPTECSKEDSRPSIRQHVFTPI